MIRCAVCNQANPNTQQRCNRCHSRILFRKTDSLSRTWALLISAALLYIPANLLPIMSITKLDITRPDTIFSGIVTLAGSGMIPIAIVVFVASMLVPMLKIVVLLILLLNAHGILSNNILHLSRLYRFIEWVGRWSMLDIFMISILTALVHSRLVEVQAGQAATAFASVVVLTMLATYTFDLRLLWDRRLASEKHAGSSYGS